jgi:photosystem II stability/assembly factor-like uncharacterized protein
VKPSPLLAAYHALAPAAAPGLLAKQTWRPLGPFCIPHGQTYGSGPRSRPSVSGRVSAIAVDPGHARHLLIGAANGGVWESTDDGLTWAPRTDGQPSLAIGAVAFDPTDPTIAYAGTGEGNSTDFGDPDLLGVGLLRSTNGGTTWTLLPAGPLAHAGFFQIVVDPADGKHLLAATTAGLFESADGGSNWTTRRRGRTWALSLRPPAADGIGETLAACADGLFRSTNGGSSWTAVPLPMALPGLQRMAVCHAPSDGNVAYVFAANQRRARIWRRSVAGGAFTQVPVPRDLDIEQAWYDWCAAVAPNNPDVLYVGAVDAYKGVRSATGAWEWTNISSKPSADGDSAHPDQHDIAFSPRDPNVVYLANDGGVYRSPDGGVSWTSIDRGLCITEVEYLAQHPRYEAWLLAGTQDNGTLRYQGDTVWHHVADGDGGPCAVNAAKPYTCYHTFYDMGVARSRRGGDWNSWTGPPEFLVGPPTRSPDMFPKGSLFYPPMAVNGRVVVQAGRTVFISRNAGQSWDRVRLPVFKDELTSTLAVPSETRVYAGTEKGRLFRIDFGRGRWQRPVTLKSPTRGYMKDLRVDTHDPDRLYAAYTDADGGRIFRSDDAGATWARADRGLTHGLPVNAMELDPKNPDTVYAAADLGVYVSRDAGKSWTPFSNGLPNALVKDLLLHPKARLLRAATQARGVWEVAVDAATGPDVNLYLRDNAVDTGRPASSSVGANDPFQFGAETFWWQCPDIKIDSPSFQRPGLRDVDFVTFADDQSLIDEGIQFAAGLSNESPQRNRTVRVYVQVHNRGMRPALKVTVEVLFAPAAMILPDLPVSFWARFPSQELPADSPWQAVAPREELASVAPGRSEIVGFEWNVPTSVAPHVALLALISAENDPLTTTKRQVATLVGEEKKCGLRNVITVNPPASVGPRVLAVPLSLTGPVSSLGADAGAVSVLRGIVLGRRLARLARKHRWKQLRLSAGDRASLRRLLVEDPSLRRGLLATRGFVPKEGTLLDGLTRVDGEPIVLLVKPRPRCGYGSIYLADDREKVLGGITIKAL